MKMKMAGMAAILAVSASVSMANITLDFVNSSQTRDFSGNVDSITLDFTVDGSGGVTLDATPVGIGTDPEYLAAVDSWDGSVGTITESSAFGTTFQLSVFVTTFDRVNLVPVGTERIALDGRYSNGIMGAGGGNGSRVDWTTGNQEILHFEQTGGSAAIKLLDFGWHAASTSSAIWDTQLIAGSADNTFYNLPGSSGVVDVSALGYVIGSGANDLTFKQPLDGSHGLGIDGLTLDVIPEPATMGLMGFCGAALLFMRARRRYTN